MRGKLLISQELAEGAVSHNVLYQQLSITRYQVRLYANNYFEKLPDRRLTHLAGLFAVTEQLFSN